MFASVSKAKTPTGASQMRLRKTSLQQAGSPSFSGPQSRRASVASLVFQREDASIHEVLPNDTPSATSLTEASVGRRHSIIEHLSTSVHDASADREATWSAMPPGPAAANSAAHVERKPEDILYARVVPSPPRQIPFQLISYYAGVCLALAYCIFLLARSQNSGRYFGAVLLLLLLAVVLHLFELLPSERGDVSRHADKIVKARTGPLLRRVRRRKNGKKGPMGMESSSRHTSSSNEPFA